MVLIGFQAASSIFLGLVFLVSSVPKLRNPRGFAVTVLAYDILPEGVARLYARTVPAVEFFAALLLVTGTAIPLGSLLAGALLLSFLVAIGVNLARGRDLKCGCFGGKRGRVDGRLLSQDLVLLAVAIAIATMSPGSMSPREWSVFRLLGLGGSVAPPAVVAALAICAGAVAYRSARPRRLRRQIRGSGVRV